MSGVYRSSSLGWNDVLRTEAHTGKALNK